MVTSAHEASHRIFQERPEILTPVFGILGIPLPEKATVDVLTPDATELRPLERRVDSVLRIGPSDGDGFLLAIEAQGRRDADKESSWAYYVSYLWAKYRLPVLLLVVCQDRGTAKWATGPFSCGARGWTAQTTHPLVVGPDNLPVITERRAVAENVAMAAFSAVVHGRSTEGTAILDPLARVLQSMDGKSAEYYYEFVEVGLGATPAGDKWREILSFVSYFPGRGTVRETAYLEGKAEGKAEDRASLILRVLDKHGVSVPEDTRDRITSCTDLDTLALWFDRALTATAAEDLFVGNPEAAEDTPDQA
ncbi:hypothetical protein GCM10011579_036540 [Streptomyces albiflavescens]|uniref:Uncharacterized protein n=1 Tax=Streptomyces albiflavescens TaxID=1623582 RepID=A0A917Y3I1_9ACTN|nr:hypothetical protein [Streptomyces albiflavescens]GGN65749.1 hypothetical protein GCM10011579_036540 [Streptomyces albiflavescens]